MDPTLVLADAAIDSSHPDDESVALGPGTPPIPITNIYYLLCYGWDVLEEKDSLADVEALESTKLTDLFARVLINGTRRLLRRGLDRGYLRQEDEIPGLRGKLQVTRTIERNLLRQGRTCCAWDELEYDTLPNQILKTTLVRLNHAGTVDASLRGAMRDLLRWLSPVTKINLCSAHFRRVQLHRNNRIYTLLLHLCEFIHEHWLPAEQGRGRPFRDFVRERLAKLFEKFVFNFYKHELPADWGVNASTIQWDCVSPNDDAIQLVPQMKTDVCLKGPARSIILDTKYYAHALSASPYGQAKLNEPNLYQLFTYLSQRSSVPGWEHAEGVLLYPRTDRDFDAEFTTRGHRIRALTLDLTQPWRTIHDRLLGIATG